MVVALPRDMLDETADMPLVEPYPVIRANPEPALIKEMVQRLGAAKNPIILAGSGTAYRALGIQVSRDTDFLPALQEALQANRPALIEVMTELEFISPTATLSQVTAGLPGR